MYFAFLFYLNPS